MAFKNSEAVGDHFRVVSGICGEFRQTAGLNPPERHHSAQCERIGLDLSARSLADTVVIRRRGTRWSMKQIVSEFVKHHEQFPLRREAAVDRNEMPAHRTVIKTAHLERHLGHRYLMLAAELVKVSLDQRTFVPGNTQAGDCIGE